MKQLRVLLLLLLFLQSKIGVAFNVHYCGGHIAKISWAFDAKDCGMEKKNFPSDVLQFTQKSCCQDDVIIAQDDSDQTTNQEKQFVDNFIQFELNDEINLPKLDPRIALQLVHPPPSIRKLYKINCAPLFYE
ncbi:MAG: hypothetical protein P8O78_02250 [Flavobacteriaceae bacterium]|jgi:hypothetical protein|nr:hypothetical protein [Flavobacteriaceae bacterium]